MRATIIEIGGTVEKTTRKLHAARTRRPKTYRIWPRGEEEAAVRITSSFAETALTEARREHFGEGPHLDWEEVEP